MEGNRDRQFVSLKKAKIEIYIIYYATKVEIIGDSDCWGGEIGYLIGLGLYIVTCHDN